MKEGRRKDAEKYRKDAGKCRSGDRKYRKMQVRR